ncbi:MAG: multidrug ABC transporter ATP-binding protein [Halobacteriovoraceae bacterium]|nr:multidrug ABC transporter ATP-binding protein [Halobacteriovoraceae bacterium]
MIKVEHLCKNFSVHKKEPGFKGSVASLFNRQYTTKKALIDFNLTINEGEIIGLIGSNGAGKTTLTKILSGIIHPTSGKVSVLGFNPWDKPNEYRQKMALIMGQKAQLWWDLPALDGFLLLKEIYQIPTRDFYDRIEFLSEYLQIKEQLNIQVRRLSLGERMKVELMAALLHQPKVIFLDEPTIGLDLTAQKAVRRFIKEYRKQYNPMMILTSHYMDDIEELCERIVIMKEGQKVFDGNIENLHQKYASKKVIKLHVFEDDQRAELINRFPKSLGQIEEIGKTVQIITPRENVSESSKFALNCSEINDFSISEQDIGNIIESIQRSGH